MAADGLCTLPSEWDDVIQDSGVIRHHVSGSGINTYWSRPYDAACPQPVTHFAICYPVSTATEPSPAPFVASIDTFTDHLSNCSAVRGCSEVRPFAGGLHWLGLSGAQWIQCAGICIAQVYSALAIQGIIPHFVTRITDWQTVQTEGNWSTVCVNCW